MPFQQIDCSFSHDSVEVPGGAHAPGVMEGDYGYAIGRPKGKQTLVSSGYTTCTGMVAINRDQRFLSHTRPGMWLMAFGALAQLGDPAETVVWLFGNKSRSSEALPEAVVEKLDKAGFAYHPEYINPKDTNCRVQVSEKGFTVFWGSKGDKKGVGFPPMHTPVAVASTDTTTSGAPSDGMEVASSSIAPGQQATATADPPAP